MGGTHSVKIRPSELSSFRVATVKKSFDNSAAPYDLFISTKGKGEMSSNGIPYHEIFTLPADFYLPDERELDIPCDLKIPFENFICVSRFLSTLTFQLCIFMN